MIRGESLANPPLILPPSKTLVWFEKAGHEPFVDEPAKFKVSMVELVRPVAMG